MSPPAGRVRRLDTQSDLERAFAFQIRAAGIRAPIDEYRFAPPRLWRFDFAWLEERVAVEVEGGLYVGGRHSRAAGFEADAEKYAEAAIAGWLVLRVTGHMVEDLRALKLLERALRARRQPDPLRPAGINAIAGEAGPDRQVDPSPRRGVR